MAEVNLLKTYPKAVRDIAKRLQGKDANRALALKFGFEYFDGPREQGYGGYRYDGRWVPIARTFVAHFGLKSGDRVLDVGCAKGFLVKDLADVCPGLEVFGLDISEYALTSAHHDIAGRLVRGSCDTLPFDDGSFDAVICINTIHNLEPSDVRPQFGNAASVQGKRFHSGRCIPQRRPTAAVRRLDVDR